MNCSDVTERLPWLVNQSLAESERAEALEHLRGCESCRKELNDTAEFLEHAPDHPAPDRITGYVFDAEMDSAERETIRKHVDGCAQCREELQLATQSRQAMPIRRGLIWRGVGIAAGLAIAVSAAAMAVAWKQTLNRAGTLEAENRRLEEQIRLMNQPTARTRIIDLLPEGLRERSGAAGGGQRTISASSAETTVLLNSQIPMNGSPCLIRLNRGESALWTSQQVERGASGEFLVRIPAEFLTKGAYRLRVECGRVEESYLFSVN